MFGGMDSCEGSRKADFEDDGGCGEIGKDYASVSLRCTEKFL